MGGGGGGVCLREISCQSTAPTEGACSVLTMVKLLEWDQGHARGHVKMCVGGGGGDRQGYRQEGQIVTDRNLRLMCRNMWTGKRACN